MVHSVLAVINFSCQFLKCPHYSQACRNNCGVRSGKVHDLLRVWTPSLEKKELPMILTIWIQSLSECILCINAFWYVLHIEEVWLVKTVLSVFCKLHHIHRNEKFDLSSGMAQRTEHRAQKGTSSKQTACVSCVPVCALLTVTIDTG